MGRPALDLSIRFVDKYIPEPNSGCWIWVGDINDSGYGIIDIRLKGIDHGMAKLSEAQVLEIRGSRARLRDISSRYGIGLSQASRLRNGQGWKHLP
jgi:hypothetical protein